MQSVPLSSFPRRFRVFALASLIGFAAFAPAHARAATGSAALAVTATIAKRASLKVLVQPASVLITESDLARGYVEVAQVKLAVQSNSPAGYLLVFENRGDFVNATQISGLGSEVQLGDSGVVPRAAPGGEAGNATLDLVLRFMLSASAQPGRHAWPMQISAMPM